MSMWKKRYEFGVSGTVFDIFSFLVGVLTILFALGFFAGKAFATDMQEAEAWKDEIVWYYDQPYGYVQAVYGPADKVTRDRACALNDGGWLECFNLTAYTYEMVDREVRFTVDELGLVRGVSGGLYVEAYDLFNQQFRY